MALAFITLPLCAAPEPKLFPLPGIPDHHQQFWVAEQLDGGWIAGTADGLLVQEQDSWRPLHPPVKGYVGGLARHPRGVVVAGDGYLFIYSRNRWVPLPSRETFTSAVSLPDRVLLSSSTSVAEVSSAGEFRVLAQRTADHSTRLHQFDGRTFVFSERSLPLTWENGEWVDASHLVPWAAGLGINSIERTPTGALLVASSDGVFEVHDNVRSSIAAEMKLTFQYEGLIGAARFGDSIVVATYDGGIRFIDTNSGKVTWTAHSSAIGTVYFMKRIPDGVLVGTSSGLYTLPDPSRFRFVSLPKRGDLLFVGTSTLGPVCGLSTGLFTFDGEPVPAPPAVFSSFVTSRGQQVFGVVGRIIIDGTPHPMPGGDLIALFEPADRHIGVLQLHRVTILGPDSPGTPLKSMTLDATATSIAPRSDGGYIVGTSSGVRLLNADLELTGTALTGRIQVQRTREDTLLFDGHGQVYDEDCQPLLSIPDAEVLDCAVHDGKWWLLVRMHRESTWLGEWDRAAGKWIPHDLPIDRGMTRIVGTTEGLVLLGSRHFLHAREPAVLAPPALNVKVGDRGPLPLPLNDQSAERHDPITLLFGGQRLAPWAPARYHVSIADGSWEEAAAIAHIAVPRLSPGQTTVRAKRSIAGMENEVALTLSRPYPPWLRWPALLAYLTALAALIWALIIWRTNRLRLRAAALEEQVEQRTAELKKAQRAREDFLSTVSHEIRNPLNGVIGICDMLGDESTEPKRIRRHVATLRGCADQLRTILDDVLDFARIDRGEITLYEEPFELQTAIEGAARSVDPKLAKTILRLPEGQVYVKGDVGKVRQIVTNLVSNALKYGVPSAAEVVLEPGPMTGENVPFHIHVRNTGPSLSAEELSRLFTEFSRGKDAVRRKIKGTGLGLAVSRKMAEVMHGSLNASSSEGMTVFTLTLALERADPADDEVETDEAIDPSVEPSRVLAIEDEEYNRMVLGHHLSQLGYEVDWAVDGASALQYARESSYDLILTDFELPDTTGDVLARELLATVPAPRPPIIAITAYSTPDKINQAKDAGICLVVTKPISKRKLRDAILRATTGGDGVQRVARLSSRSYKLTVFEVTKKPREMLLHYADAVSADWTAITAQCLAGASGPAAGKVIHGFRSRILIVHASELADDLNALETAVVQGDTTNVRRLLPHIEELVSDLIRQARDHAFARAS